MIIKTNPPTAEPSEEAISPLGLSGFIYTFFYQSNRTRVQNDTLPVTSFI